MRPELRPGRSAIFRQLGDVGGDAPRLVAGELLDRRAGILSPLLKLP
jgi:hypothetical protein